MQPAVLLLLPLLPLVSLLRLPVATADTNGAFGSCLPATCGVLNFTYPFSISGVQPMYCGFPVFALTCDGGRAYLRGTFRENLYRVRNITYEDTSLVVAVETTFVAGNETCRIPDFNVSSRLALFPFNISRTNKNLVFLYNCALHHGKPLKPQCANHTFLGAYIISGRPDEVDKPPQELPQNCSYTSVPVREFQGMEPARDYERLISEGFQVEWPRLRKAECDECRGRGGECRFVKLSFYCICPDGKPCRNSPGGIRKTMKIRLIVLMSVAASLLLPCIYVLGRHRKRVKLHISIWQKISSDTERKIEALIVSHGSLAPKRYKYSEVTKMTSSLNHRLGEGGYGMVFKGRLDDSRVVAVKFLHDSKGGEEFVNEVMSIGRTSHVNIVSLFGFCLDGSKRALIYEFMPNGSLDKYIYSKNPKEALGWDKLYTIAIGIARGLEYLHHRCNTRIVHFDIKPSNILLDQNFQPKIADFGLAKLCRTNESRLSMTGARGTVGFIAPEVHSRTFGVVSTKSDVYSYGMMLLEMVGGSKNVNSVAQKSSERYFPHWIYDHFDHCDGLQACEVSSENEGIARKMSVIGLWCIQILPMHRPTITKVLEMFERHLDELDMPPRQNFSQILEDPSYSLNVEITGTASGTKT